MARSRAFEIGDKVRFTQRFLQTAKEVAKALKRDYVDFDAVYTVSKIHKVAGPGDAQAVELEEAPHAADAANWLWGEAYFEIVPSEDPPILLADAELSHIIRVVRK